MATFKQSTWETSVSGSRMDRRDTQELIGICRGVLADGEVNKSEALFLADWIERHAARRDSYPFNVLYQRLADALQDGVVDDEEEAALLAALVGIVGGEAEAGNVASLSASLPLDDPAPLLDCKRAFVLTGTFECGTRTVVTKMVQHLGGQVSGSVSKACGYVLVGNIATASWAHSSYGTKIEAGISLRSAGHPIAIISERHWLESFPDARDFLAAK